MKYFPVVLLFATLVCAQDSNVPPGSSELVKADLLRIEREIGRANFDCDYKYFAQVEGEEFIFTDASGGVTTKATSSMGPTIWTKPGSTCTEVRP
jgi:hypothetical protein